MLLFILSRLMFSTLPKTIQIHLMLLFIKQDKVLTHTLKTIQIHLMLLFIGICVAGLEPYQRFKYISCYCLSKQTVSEQQEVHYSNTSHVIVYLMRPGSTA